MNPPVATPAALERELADEDLVAALRAGDESAFSEIHERYRQLLGSYCTRLLGCADEAEDAVQLTFLKAHQSLIASDNEIALGPWLYTIARNESFTILRARQRRPVAPLDHDTAGSVPCVSEQALTREQLRETLADIRALPSEQREALIQTSLDAVSGQQVAESLGCEPAKVKSLVFRARAHLTDLRAAREISCLDVKAQIAEGSGAALRQRVIKEHLRRCESCSELAGRPRFRRKLAGSFAFWPILPSKLGALFAGAAESAGTWTGAAAASGVGAKTVSVAVAVAVTAGGVAVNRDADGATPGAAVRDQRPAQAPRGAAGPLLAADAAGPTAIGVLMLGPNVPHGGAASDPTSSARADRRGKEKAADLRHLPSRVGARRASGRATTPPASPIPASGDGPGAAVGKPAAPPTQKISPGHAHQTAPGRSGNGGSHGTASPPPAAPQPPGADPPSRSSGQGHGQQAGAASGTGSPGNPAATQPGAANSSAAPEQSPPGHLKNSKAN